MFIDLGDLDAASEMIDRTLALSPEGALTHFTRAYFHLRRNDLEAASTHAQKLRGRLRGDGLQMLRVLDNIEGRTDDALARYARAYPGLFTEHLPRIDWQNYRAAIDVAGLLIEAGEKNRAGALLNVARAAIANKPVKGQYGKGIADAEIAALAGQRKAALELLEAAVTQGWRMRWWLWTELNPNFDALRDDGAFRRIVASLEADMAGQLADVRILIDSGELKPLLSAEELAEN
jgi:hypothetical protein